MPAALQQVAFATAASVSIPIRRLRSHCGELHDARPGSAWSEGMRRFLIFALLGSPVGLAVMMVLTSYISERAIIPDARLLTYGLPLAYVVGTVPALFA